MTAEIGGRGGTRGSVFDSSVATRTLCFEPGVSTRLTSVYRRSPQTASNHTALPSPGSAPADTASTLLYQHADHLTTRVTTDNAGTLSNQQAHYPYGENWYATGTADPSVKRKFTSYRKEGGSLAAGQINYAIARYHAVRTGRFTSPDPIHGKNPQRLNRYAYVMGDPISRIDPSGLESSDGLDTPCDPETYHCRGEEWDSDFLGYVDGGGGGFVGTAGGGGVTNGFTACVQPTPPVLAFSPTPTTPSFGCAMPQGSRQCFAKLRGRPGAFGAPVLIYHLWWYVKGSEGKGIISGDGSRQPPYLNAYYSAGTRSTVNADSRSAGWLVWDSGESRVHCARVDRMVRAAKTFPNGTVLYGIAGPNSNSIAGCMGAVGGFHPRVNSWLYAGFNQPVAAGDCPPGY